MGKERYRRDELFTIRDALTADILEQAFNSCLVLPAKDPVLMAVSKDSAQNGLNMIRTRFGSTPHEDEKQTELKRQVVEAIHHSGDSPSNTHYGVYSKKMHFGGGGNYSLLCNWPAGILETGRFSLEERIRLVDFYRSEKDIASCTYLMKREFGRFRPADFYTNEKCRAELVAIIQEPFAMVNEVYQARQKPKAPNPGSTLLMSALLNHLRNQNPTSDENQDAKETETTSDIKKQESTAKSAEVYSAPPKPNKKKLPIKEVVFVTASKSEQDIKKGIDKNKLKMGEMPSNWERKRGRRGSRTLKCYKCGKKGHMARDCQDDDKKNSGLEYIV